MADQEVWKAIPGVNGYEASTLGRIRSVDRLVIQKNGKRRFFHGKVRILFTDPNGYEGLTLLRPQRHYHAHKLVALAFLGEPPLGMEVCHNNNNKTDNRLSNLRYDTKSGNWLDRLNNGTYYKGNYKLTRDQVKEIRNVIPSLAQKYGVSKTAIREILFHKTWKRLDVEDPQK